MSAHRTPEVVRRYATTAAARGLKVIIAAAGGAAHLAGVVAAHTTLPVIGMPVPTRPRAGSIRCCRPCRCPATCPWPYGVGMGGPRNAGLFAVQILATADEALRTQLAEFKQALADKIAAKDAALQKRLASA